MVDGITVKILRYTPDAHRLIAEASRVSITSETGELTEEDIEKWIVETYRRGYFSPWEHASYTFEISGLSRVASHQLVRHRIASYTQLSHRYSVGYLDRMAVEAAMKVGLDCNYESKNEKRLCYARALKRLSLSPDPMDLEIASLAYVLPPLLPENIMRWLHVVFDSTAKYYEMLASGVKKENARYILPNCLRTKIVVTMNARELIQVFFPLRMCSHAQWEIRFIAWSMWRELMKIHPQLFKYAGPSCVFRENTERMYPSTLEDYLEGRERFTISRCPELVVRDAIQKCLRNATGLI